MGFLFVGSLFCCGSLLAVVSSFMCRIQISRSFEQFEVCVCVRIGCGKSEQWAKAKYLLCEAVVKKEHDLREEMG